MGWQISRTSEEGGRYRANGWWRDRTSIDDFLACAEQHPDKAAIVAFAAGVEQPQTVTYGQLCTYVERCAAALIELGIAPGDVVSLQLPNSVEFPILALATLRIGAWVNPIPTVYRERELAFMLRHGGSKLLAVPSEFRGFSHEQMARRFRETTPTLEHVVTVGAAHPGFLDFQRDILERGRHRVRMYRAQIAQRRPEPDMPAMLMYTSGTTGVPKGAVHSFNTLWSAGQPIADAIHMSNRDTCFMASTVGHLTGFYWGMLLPLSTGQKVVYQDIWDADRFLDIVEQERVTWTVAATPFAIDAVEARKKRSADLGSLRAFVCGGATIPPEVAWQVQDTLGVGLISLWGCTEVGVCSIHEVGTPIATLAASDGKPVSYKEVRIVDEDDRVVALGEVGRLQVRGPSVFLGYFKQDDLTAEATTRDGWFDTGDQGRMTDDGGVRITGRTKDIIIRGGQNVPVVELENELLRLPSVREVAVIGLPDARLGERGCAVIVPNGAPPTLEDIRRCLGEAGFAKPFWPEHLKIVQEMPRTPSGKIQKFALRELLSQDSDR